MNTYQFKTNINCSGCVAKVTPHLNEAKAIQQWSVDTQNPQKILTVQTERLPAEAIINIVNNAGFKAEPII